MPHNHTTFHPAAILCWEKSPSVAGRPSEVPANYHAVIARTPDGHTLTACGHTYPDDPNLPQSLDPLLKCRNCQAAIARQQVRLQLDARIANHKAAQGRHP